jgi:hypothetical protein
MPIDTNKYSTIQIKKELSELVSKYCKDKGLKISFVTEQYWIGILSSSMSGSAFI